jgi:hypothetical protein
VVVAVAVPGTTPSGWVKNGECQQVVKTIYAGRRIPEVDIKMRRTGGNRYDEWDVVFIIACSQRTVKMLVKCLHATEVLFRLAG